MPPTLLQRGSLCGDPRAVPVDRIVDWVKKRMPEFGGRPPAALRDRVIVARSETGSGKSTVLPAHVFRLYRGPATPARERYRGRSVLCTQPRVLTAVTLARDMAASPHYPELALPAAAPAAAPGAVAPAGVIGYQTMPITNKPPSGLIYATAGVLLAQLKGAAIEGDFSAVSRKYACIIVDEAHERSLDTDVLLTLLKKYLLAGIRQGGRAASDLPFVILASATIAVEPYAAYFDLLDARGLPLESNVFRVVGRQHGIACHWPAVGTNDYCAEAAAVAARIHCEHPDDPPDQRDVLIFMPGQAEAARVATALEKARDLGRLDRGGAAVILTINRDAVNRETSAFTLVKAPPEVLWRALETQELYGAEKLAALRGVAATPRRFVVSTVIAETGLTIETLKYVVDGGWQRAVERYFPGGAGGLLTRPAARSRILQRKGRAGRLFPGHFYPLYTEKVFDALPEQQLPEAIAEGVSDAFLDLVYISGLGAPGALDAAAGAGAAASSAPGDEDGSVLPPPGAPFRVEDLDMLDTPPVDAFAAAVEEATLLGFFAEGRATRLGALATRFTRAPLAARRLLLAAPLWGCALSDLATVAAAVRVCGDRGRRAVLDRRLARRLRDESAVAAALAAAAAEGAPAFLGRTGLPILQDDHLELLCVFEGFASHLARAFTVGEGGLRAGREWCEARQVDHGTLVQLLAAREELLEEAAIAGLNPAWGDDLRLATAGPAEFAGRVQALKRCLLDAYRGNVLEGSPNPRTQRLQYRDRFGRRVEPFAPAPAGAGGPRRLLASSIAVVPAPPGKGQKAPPLRWVLRAPLVSVLDTATPETAAADDPSFLAPGPSAPS